jgi:hypothetical protein
VLFMISMNSMPVVISVGAGLLALGIMIASAGSDELM